MVDEVGTLIKAFRSQGADRVTDILLEEDFPGFFNTDVTTASYTGNLQRALRDVEIEDFPVRKDNRAGFEADLENTLIGSYDDVLPTLPVP